MSIFIKPGFWDERKLAPKHWLNLTQLITNTISTIVPSLTYKSLVILVTQNNSDPELVATLENTIGEFSLVKNDVGNFSILFPNNNLIPEKTTAEIANNFSGTLPFANHGVYTWITTPDSSGQVSFYSGILYIDTEIYVSLQDQILDNPTKIEIRVYN